LVVAHECGAETNILQHNTIAWLSPSVCRTDGSVALRAREKKRGNPEPAARPRMSGRTMQQCRQLPGKRSRRLVMLVLVPLRSVEVRLECRIFCRCASLSVHSRRGSRLRWQNPVIRPSDTNVWLFMSLLVVYPINLARYAYGCSADGHLPVLGVPRQP